MRIRYLKNDPRAGMEVDLDDNLGQRQIERGSAEEVKSHAAPANKAESNPQNKADRVEHKKASEKPAKTGKKAD